MEIRILFVFFSRYVSRTLNNAWHIKKNVLNICLDFLEFDWNSPLPRSSYIRIVDFKSEQGDEHVLASLKGHFL